MHIFVSACVEWYVQKHMFVFVPICPPVYVHMSLYISLPLHMTLCLCTYSCAYIFVHSTKIPSAHVGVYVLFCAFKKVCMHGEMSLCGPLCMWLCVSVFVCMYVACAYVNLCSCISLSVSLCFHSLYLPVCEH